MPTKQCAECGRDFEAARQTAKFCGDRCRKRASRGAGDEIERLRRRAKELADRQVAERVTQKRIPDYFAQYQQAISGAGERAAGAYSKAGSEISAASAGAAKYAEDLRKTLASEEQANAALRGVAYDPSGAQTNTASQLARLNAADVLAGVIGAQGASEASYYGDKGRIAEREKIEQLLRSAARQRQTKQELRSLGREEGDIRREELSRIRDLERDYLLARKAARQPGAERRHETREAQRGRRFESREAAKGRRFEARQAGLDRRAERKGSASGNQEGGRQRRRETREDIRDMLSLIRTTPEKKRKKLGKQGIIDLLSTKYEGFSHKEARKAYAKYNRRRRKRALNPTWLGL